MTIRKAIAVMGNVSTMINDYVVERDGPQVIGQYSEELDAINMSIAALRDKDREEGLATPKRPTRIRFAGTQYEDIFVGRCPVCRKGTDSRYKFCQNCGQALEWGWEEES